MSGPPTNPPIHIRSPSAAGNHPETPVSMNEGGYPQYQSWPAQAFVTPDLQHPRLAPPSQGHRRLPSDSSATTSALNSPHSHSSAYPYIVDSENYSVPSPHLESYDIASTYYPKASSTSQPTFSESFLNPAFEGYNPAFGDLNAYMATQAATRPAMSGPAGNGMTYGASSSSGPGGYRYGNGRAPPDSRTSVPKFDRTLTDIYQDELYRPCIEDDAAYSSSQQPQPYTQQANLLSPTTPSILSSRLQQAQEKRSLSPPQDVVREPSPFRTGSAAYSELYSDAVSTPNRPPASRLNTPKTATQMREQEKARRDALAIAQHTPHRYDAAGPESEAPKTISPREALIDDPDPDDVGQLPLFPPHSQQHQQQHQQQQESGSAMSQPQTQQEQPGNLAFRRRQQAAQQSRESNNAGAQASYAFLTRRHSSHRDGGSSGNTHDPLDFPSQLTSMESTKSDNSSSTSPQRVSMRLAQQPSASSDLDFPTSSQRSADLPSPLRRPENTSANSGSYTCPASSCTARFSTATLLQKHKRDAHPDHPSAARTPVSATFPKNSSSTASPRSQHHHAHHHHHRHQPSTSTTTSTTANAASITSPSITTTHSDNHNDNSINANRAGSSSNNPSNTTNAALGPHKCTRLNPTTGKPCNTIFSRSYDLTRHEDTIHNNRKQKVRCAHCTEEKTFSRNDALTRHMRVVHPEVEFRAGSGRRGGSSSGAGRS